MISIVPPDDARPDRDTRIADVYRSGLTSARRELQAGTARRYRSEPSGVRPSRGSSGAPSEVGGPSPSPTSASSPSSALVVSGPAGSAPAVDLDLQRAGVRAALAELRQHRGLR